MTNNSICRKVFLAVDLGAGSGRVMAAIFDGAKIALEEVSRWASAPVKIGGAFHWDADAIFKEITSGIKKARAIYGGAIESVGIDSWAVDYGLLDSAGNLLNKPFIYRDTRTDGMMEKVFAKVPTAEIYKKTGIQFLFFNTLYQIEAEILYGKNIQNAKSFLMMPDLFAYMLTGEKFNERTNASSTQFYNPFKREWDFEILEKIGAPSEIFKNGFAECGDVVGKLRAGLKEELGDMKVVAVASHDTASAVAATPSQSDNPAYINSGTWSLPGVELKAPLASDAAFKENFTNEVGAENTIRFLKNVTGMWLVQKSKEAWAKEGRDTDYKTLEAAAAQSEAMRTIIDPDAPDFVMPENMPRAIANYCSARNIPVPQDQGQLFRAIQESIALKYAYVFKTIEDITGVKPDSINVMGGGSKDAFLNQFTADATGKTVLAGPTESTALGNAIMQMKASGDISDLRQGRALIAASVSPKIFSPNKANRQIWDAAYEKFYSGKNPDLKAEFQRKAIRMLKFRRAAEN